MMRKVKVKSSNKSSNKSSLKRMGINLYGDNVTAPKLELPTAQFGDKVLGRSNQPDPGNIRSSTKTSAIEEAKRRQEAKDQGVGTTIGLSAAGFVTGALEAIPGVGQLFAPLNEKVQEKDKSGAAGIASGIGKAAVGTTSAVLSGGTMGTGDIAEGVGDVMGGSSEIAYNKGNDKKSERLGKAGQAFDTIAPIADMASGLAGGIKGAEGAEGMFKGPEGIKGGIKSLLGGTPSAEGGMKGVMKGFDTLDSFDTFDMNTTSEVNSLPFGKFGTKLPLEMELMPEGGKMVDGYLHEEGGVITKHRGKAVAEIEGGEGITKIREEGKEEEKKGGVVYSNTTINSETGNTFSKDAKKWIESKDKSEIGVNTGRLELERLYKLQEEEKIKKGLVNRGENMKKYKKGGSLKATPLDNKGLPQLPESVLNQMNYMKKDGGLRAKINVKNKTRVKEKLREKPAKLKKNGYTMGEYNSFKNYAGNAGQTLSTNDVARLNELGFTKTYNLNDFSRGFNKLQQPGGTLDQNFLPKFKDGGKASKSGKNSNSPNTKGTLDRLAKRDNIFLPKTFDGINYDSETAIPKKDIFSTTETGVTGKPMLKTLGERLLRNADGSLSYFNKNYRGEDDGDGKNGKDRKGNLTPGDIKQLAGNMVAPLANLGAMRSIRENTAPRGKDRSITREQKLSNSGKERKTRQIFAALNNADISDARKATAAVRANEAIQDIGQATDTTNAQLALTKDKLDKETYKFNITQGDLTKVDKQTRKDLAITTGLTGAEQVATNLGNYGGLENNNLTIQAQLKVLKEAFPDFTITTDNMKSFIKALSTGKEEEIYKYRT